MRPARWAQITDLATRSKCGRTNARRTSCASYEGLADAAAAQQGMNAPDVRRLLERSATTWREVFAQSVGDHRERDRRERGEATGVASPLKLVGRARPLTPAEP